MAKHRASTSARCPMKANPVLVFIREHWSDGDASNPVKWWCIALQYSWGAADYDPTDLAHATDIMFRLWKLQQLAVTDRLIRERVIPLAA